MKSNFNNNYLDKIPVKNNSVNWDIDLTGKVILQLKNRGFINKLSQKLFRRPKFSYIHLDEYGSFIWQNTDGVKNIILIGELFKSEFGEKTEPLYERLSIYFDMLFKCSLITFKQTN